MRGRVPCVFCFVRFLFCFVFVPLNVGSSVLHVVEWETHSHKIGFFARISPLCAFLSRTSHTESHSRRFRTHRDKGVHLRFLPLSTHVQFRTVLALEISCGCFLLDCMYYVCVLFFVFFCFSVRFWLLFFSDDSFSCLADVPKNKSSIPFSRNESEKSLRGVPSSKSRFIERSSSSVCPRCMARRKVVWGCPSFQNCPFFRIWSYVLVLKILRIRFWLVGNNSSNGVGGKIVFPSCFPLGESVRKIPRSARPTPRRCGRKNVCDWPIRRNRVEKKAEIAYEGNSHERNRVYCFFGPIIL